MFSELGMALLSFLPVMFWCGISSLEQQNNIFPIGSLAVYISAVVKLFWMILPL